MKSIAVVGAGVSGLVCAHLLHRQHRVTLYEAADRLGGHSNTVDVELDGRTLPVDTGFIVYNEANYPHFSKILRTLGVATQETTMSFSVRCDRTGLEYGGESAIGLFAQRSNLVRPRFWAMLRDIRRFGGRMRDAAVGAAESLTLGEHLIDARYSRAFVDDYLLPMAGAIWSAPPDRMRDFPLRSFVAFFDNHGMLEPWRAPRWRTIVGGSREYVRRLSEPFADRTRMSTPIERVVRTAGGVEITTASGQTELFDEVIFAVHSDQALRMLADADDAERDVLESVPYQRNVATLHTDPASLPLRRRAWAAWNYHRPVDATENVRVTYLMNMLQRLPVETPVCVTLNDTGTIDRDAVIAEIEYHHPVYTPASFAAHARLPQVSGSNRVHFCGAWCGYGFHEDGVRSAVAVGERFGATL